MKKRFSRILAAAAAATMVIGSMSLSAFAAQDASGLAAGTAYLNLNNADWADFEAEYTNVEITGDGSYTVSAALTAPLGSGQFEALEVVDGEATLGTGCVLTVDSIVINGAEVKMAGESYTLSADGKGETTRVNIYNEWNSPDAEATAGDDGHVDNRCADGDVTTKTAMLITAEEVASIETIDVNFTVSNFGQAAGAAAEGEEGEDGEEAVDTPAPVGGVYHAYIGFQTPKYSFRNEWNEPNYGLNGAEGAEFFYQVTGWDESNNAVVYPGTFTDVEFDGNGTFTVSANGLEFAADEFDSQEYMNLIFCSTDIPNDGTVTISDVVVTVNGAVVKNTDATNIISSPEDDQPSDYVTISVQNNWSDNKEIGYYKVPVTDISIQFTVSGLAQDNTIAQPEAETEAPETVAPETGVAQTEASETAAADDKGQEETKAPEKVESKGGFFPLPGIPIICGVVVVVVVIVIVCTKKKN